MKPLISILGGNTALSCPDETVSPRHRRLPPLLTAIWERPRPPPAPIGRGLSLRLCIPPSAAPQGPGGRGRGTVPRVPARENWYAEPAKVADNLYFLGTKVHSAWAVVGSEGIIIIEALFDYAAKDEILDGMKKLGLDQSKVKYVILSHAHADHDGGAKLLQDEIPRKRASHLRPGRLGCHRQKRQPTRSVQTESETKWGTMEWWFRLSTRRCVWSRCPVIPQGPFRICLKCGITAKPMRGCLCRGNRNPL